VGAEVTGPCFSPDFTALFVSIQHPGKDGTESTWPYGHPRPSVVVVTKNDGGVIGT
jgi:secreted PhoX family phosphatase